VLKELTGGKPSLRKARDTIREFGTREGENIAAIVTLRGTTARDFLQRALEAIGKKLKASSFDDYGNVSFGLKEHIDIPGARYDPDLGIFGMDVTAVITRPGYRVARR
jgi:large subunit ribosomal protein L5